MNNFVNTGHKHMKFSPSIDIVEIHIVLKFHCSISFLTKVIRINVLKHRTPIRKMTKFIVKLSSRITSVRNMLERPGWYQ